MRKRIHLHAACKDCGQVRYILALGLCNQCYYADAVRRDPRRAAWQKARDRAKNARHKTPDDAGGIILAALRVSSSTIEDFCRFLRSGIRGVAPLSLDERISEALVAYWDRRIA